MSLLLVLVDRFTSSDSSLYETYSEMCWKDLHHERLAKYRLVVGNYSAIIRHSKRRHLRFGSAQHGKVVLGLWR
ncbi:hypothetical protein EON65_44220 [archaeon]|nr:MAG: hypothetical protein EON65_44220 [archaeon]